MNAIASGEELKHAGGVDSPWTLFKAGELTYKVVNFDNEIYAPKIGIIELVPMKRTNRHQNTLRMSAVLDTTGDFFYGIPAGFDRISNSIKWQPIVIFDYETLDLSVPDQRKKWIVIKNGYSIEKSPNLQGKPKYKVYNKEEEAQKFMLQRAPKRRAIEVAEGLIGRELIAMGRAHGFQVETMSETQLAAKIIQSAEENHVRFLEFWNNPSRVQVAILHNGIATGVLHVDPINGYMYGGLQLGISEAFAVDYLTKDPHMCQVIDQESKKKESASIKAMASKTKESTEDETTTRLKQRIAELEAENQRISHAKLSEMADIAVDKITATEDPELAALKAEAKALKVSGWNLIKDKEKLRKSIADKKTEAQN
jgi:hypothetical protein